MSCGACPESGQLAARAAALSGGQVMLGWALDVEQWFAERRAAGEIPQPELRQPELPAPGFPAAEPVERSWPERMEQAAKELIADGWIRRELAAGSRAPDEVVIWAEREDTEDLPTGPPDLLIACRRGSQLLYGCAGPGAVRFALPRKNKFYGRDEDAAWIMHRLREEALKKGLLFCPRCGTALAGETCPTCAG